MSKTKVELLNDSDIFDFYGSEYIYTHSSAEKYDKSFAASRIDEIHQKYLYVSRERIKSEARFCGVSDEDLKSFSFREMFKKFDQMLEQEMVEQSDKLMKGGHFNALQMIAKAQQESGQSLKGLNLERFGVKIEEKAATPKKTINPESFLKNPKWKVIADAFIALEEASTTAEKVVAIDVLNDLQHNSFYILIDLQTGRMLEGNSKGENYGKHDDAVKVVKQVLDIKHKAKSPVEYTSKMSSDIAKMVYSYSKL